jgi:argininosuccinate synthase
MKKKSKMKVVLAYSGGLDTSVIVRWLIETYQCEVIAYVADVGQKEELEGLEEKAIKTGASKCYIENLQEEFARDFILPALRANAVYEGTYLLGTSLARPLIAKRQVEIAHAEGAHAVCHGATGKGNDQVRFELTYMALDPISDHLCVERPNWTFDSRNAMLEYAAKHKIPVPLVSKEKPYSSDRNSLHISHEGGILEDPWAEPPEDIFVLTCSPEAAPDQPTYLEIDFSREPGRHQRKKDESGPSDGLCERGRRKEWCRSGGPGGKSLCGYEIQGVYETPGGTVLWSAHRALESLTMDREVMLMRDSLIPSMPSWFTMVFGMPRKWRPSRPYR